MSTTAAHLITCALHWRDLQDALGGRSTPTWPPAGRMADHIRNLDQADAEQLEEELARALELRTLERNPAQIGERPIPIRLPIHETMRIVHEQLVECADAIAGSVQRPVMGLLPAGYPEADRRRRELLVMQDRRDPRRWSWTKVRPDAPYAALWLLARVQGAPGPFRPLTPLQRDHIDRVAREAARRVEEALDIAAQRRTLEQPHDGCSGRIDVHGGEGRPPVAHCRGCGRIWSEGEVVAA